MNSPPNAAHLLQSLATSLSLLIWLLCCQLTQFTAYSAESTSRPNVVIILADDLGYGDVHCFNYDRGRIATPNIDRLAAGGMRFTDGHCSSGCCSPSRYTLLTGRYH